MRIAIIALSGHGKTSFMMSALGNLIDKKLDGISVEIVNGSNVIDKKVIKTTYKRLKDGEPIDNTFTSHEFLVTLKIGFLFKKNLDLRWRDYPGGDMIDTTNIGKIKEWIDRSDGAILLYDLSKHCEEQLGVLDLTIASVRSKVDMKPDYPVVFAMTKKDLVGSNVENSARSALSIAGGFIHNQKSYAVTTKGFPDAHLALIGILIMAIDCEVNIASQRLNKLNNQRPESIRDRLALRKSIKETMDQIEEYRKIRHALDRSQLA